MNADEMAEATLSEWRKTMDRHQIAALLESIDTLIELGE